MFGKFGKIALGLAAVAGLYAGASHLLKKYYEYLGDEPEDFDEGDELGEDDDGEVPNPMAEEASSPAPEIPAEEEEKEKPEESL